MFRVEAEPVSAQVVDLQSIGDRSDVVLVTDSVGGCVSASAVVSPDSDAAVSAGVCSPSPYPAFRFVVYDHVVVESFASGGPPSPVDMFSHAHECTLLCAGDGSFLFRFRHQG